jgi:uncharacterized coiled-coil DUF342 family protein
MKITAEQLRRIIKEEVERMLQEGDYVPGGLGSTGDLEKKIAELEAKQKTKEGLTPEEKTMLINYRKLKSPM